MNYFLVELGWIATLPLNTVILITETVLARSKIEWQHAYAMELLGHADYHVYIRTTKSEDQIRRALNDVLNPYEVNVADVGAVTSEAWHPVTT